MNRTSARARKLRRALWVLHAATAATIAWVSYSSHEIVTWVGIGYWPAWMYPVIVDAAILYVTPFVADALIPDTADWPIRREAARIQRVVLTAVASFNVLHQVLLVPVHLPGVHGPLRVVAYATAVVIGVVPVLFYGWAHRLAARIAAWAAAEDEKDAATARAKEEKAAERAERRAAPRKETFVPREVPAAASNGHPREVPRTAGRPSSKELTAEQIALLDSLPGESKKDKTVAFLVRRHVIEDNPIDGTKAAALLGADPATTRKIYNELRATGRLDPAEAEGRPQLTLAAR